MKKNFIKNWIRGTVLTSVALALPFVMNAQTIGSSTAQSHANPLRANIWYFGDHAGLDFTNGNPVALTNGAMASFECVSTMCDNTGNLLFYSNGGSFPYTGGVWNRNHQIMPNGVMTGRGGCNSSEQGSIIVPLPRSSSIYYLFTTDCMENGAVGGLRYNIIDMNADGGLGDVVSAANQLVAPTDESMTVAQHANGVDYWIITHKYQTDSFFCYHLNSHGIAGVVKTKIGYVTPDYAGALKVSGNGQKLVYSGLNWTSLFDFDNYTGAITHHVDLNQASYTAAFSQRCGYLYVANGGGKNIYQFDMNAQNIATSKVLVGTTTSTGLGGMALGPDNRIYVSRFVSCPYLGVINVPEQAGVACNYVDTGIYLGGKMSKGGLPQYPNSLIGGCTNYVTEGQGTGPDLTQISVDYFNTHHVGIHWTDFQHHNLFRVIHRKAGTQNWEQNLVTEESAVLEDLEPNTQYEIKVMPIEIDYANYEPIANHFVADKLGATNTEGTTPSTFASTTGELDFDLYPNPAKGNASVALNVGDVNSDLSIRVTDIEGKLVNEIKASDINGYNRYQLPTDELSDGIYNVQVATAQTSTTKKLVIVR